MQLFAYIGWQFLFFRISFTRRKVECGFEQGKQKARQQPICKELCCHTLSALAADLRTREESFSS